MEGGDLNDPRSASVNPPSLGLDSSCTGKIPNPTRDAPTEAETDVISPSAIRIALYKAQASLFGTSTSEGERAIEELHTLLQAGESPTSSFPRSNTISSVPVDVLMRGTEASQHARDEGVASGGPLVLEGEQRSPGGVNAGPSIQHASNNVAGSGENPPRGTQGAPLGDFGQSHGDEEEQGVLCDVVDLFYGIGIPAAHPTGPSAWVRAAAKWTPCSRASKGRSVTGADSEEGGLPPVKPLLQGINFRVSAGDMVAVIVSTMHTKQLDTSVETVETVTPDDFL